MQRAKQPSKHPFDVEFLYPIRFKKKDPHISATLTDNSKCKQEGHDKQRHDEEFHNNDLKKDRQPQCPICWRFLASKYTNRKRGHRSYGVPCVRAKIVQIHWQSPARKRKQHPANDRNNDRIQKNRQTQFQYKTVQRKSQLLHVEFRRHPPLLNRLFRCNGRNDWMPFTLQLVHNQLQRKLKKERAYLCFSEGSKVQICSNCNLIDANMGKTAN